MVTERRKDPVGRRLMDIILIEFTLREMFTGARDLSTEEVERLLEKLTTAMKEQREHVCACA